MASWTTTCAISGTVWDGPSGCPIISPSNWQTYVLDNLTVLSVHNHSGSAGEGLFVPPGSFFPAMDNDYFSAFFPTASLNWVQETQGGAIQVYNGVIATSTQNACVTYDVYLRTGTYTLDIHGLRSTGETDGRFTACINGASVGVAPAGVYFTSVCGFSVSNAGEKQLALKIETNGGSTYIAKFSAINIRRTGS